MEQAKLFPENAFDGIFNTDREFLVQINYLIKCGKLEKARELADDSFHDDSDPTYKYYLNLINQQIDKIEPEEREVITGPYDGTDISPYLALEKKVNSGTATNEDHQQLLTFWHSYPDEKDHNFRIQIFKQQIYYRNIRGINPELIYLLINNEERFEYKYFYILFAYHNSYMGVSSFRDNSYMGVSSFRDYRRLVNHEFRLKGKKIS